MDRGVLGAKLTQLRKERGFTQSNLAERTNVSRTTINNIEKGEQSITLDMFARVSEALGYEPHALLRIVQEPQNITSGAKDNKDLEIRKIIQKAIQSIDEDVDNKTK